MGKSCPNVRKITKKLRKYHPKLEKITQNEEKMPEMGKSCLKWEKNQQKWRQYHPNVEKITQNEEKNCLKWEKVAPNGRKIT